jgi:hypothetical protein
LRRRLRWGHGCRMRFLGLSAGRIVEFTHRFFSAVFSSGDRYTLPDYEED